MQENGMVTTLNNILKHALTKVCNVGCDECDHRVLAVL